MKIFNSYMFKNYRMFKKVKVIILCRKEECKQISTNQGTHAVFQNANIKINSSSLTSKCFWKLFMLKHFVNHF